MLYSSNSKKKNITSPAEKISDLNTNVKIDPSKTKESDLKDPIVSGKVEFLTNKNTITRNDTTLSSETMNNTTVNISHNLLFPRNKEVTVADNKIEKNN